MNLILKTDSYKASHWRQYPAGTDGYFGYGESRGSDGIYDRSVFFGLQIFLKEVLSKPFTLEDINEADEFFKLHGVPFNRVGWLHILAKHNGYMPVRIKAVPEGMVIPLHHALFTVESTDPLVFWAGSYLETMIMRAVWYPTTVATNSWYCKQIIKRYLDRTSDDPEGQIAFKLHDFGGRGVSSGESARIGGAAHLVNFLGSDTIEGIVCANENYNCKMAGFSIPAAEHSTITSWGKENELEAYKNILRIYKGKMFACVSDSYDIFKACDMWGTELKQAVIDHGAPVVIRPDSGDPVAVVSRVMDILGKHFGFSLNNKGFKVLNNVRVIQGDGINVSSISQILGNLCINNWSADNIAFGMGGKLLQGLDRDTLQFAMKCSAISVNGQWRDVFKNPVTDSGKKSKAGRLSLYKIDDKYVTTADHSWGDKKVEVLQTVFENGRILKEYTLDEVRANSNKGEVRQ